MVTRVWEKVKESNVRQIMQTKKLTKEQSIKYLSTQKAPTYIEKYVKASDFLRCHLMSELPENNFDKLNKARQRKNLVSLLIALQEQLDTDEIVKLLVKYDRIGSLFLLIEDKRFDKTFRH
jgi:hypothetical protein